MQAVSDALIGVQGGESASAPLWPPVTAQQLQMPVASAGNAGQRDDRIRLKRRDSTTAKRTAKRKSKRRWPDIGLPQSDNRAICLPV